MECNTFRNQATTMTSNNNNKKSTTMLYLLTLMLCGALLTTLTIASPSSTKHKQESGTTDNDRLSPANMRYSSIHQRQQVFINSNRGDCVGGLPHHTPTRRDKRSVGDIDYKVTAVSGTWFELNCPLTKIFTSANDIIWEKDGVKIVPNHRQRANANGSLVITGAQKSNDEGIYSCRSELVASHHHSGPNRFQFSVRLIVPPKVSNFEFPRDAQVGMKVNILCSVLEGDQPVSFQWLKDGQPIYSDTSLPDSMEDQQPPLSRPATMASHLSFKLNNGDVSSSSTVGGSASLHEYSSKIKIRNSEDYSMLLIDRIDLNHSGNYTCRVRNEGAQTFYSSVLTINAAPTFTIEPHDREAVSGETILIDCAANGQPRPTISWKRARESGEPGNWDFSPIYDSSRFTTFPNGSLIITNLTSRESGFYLCAARNGYSPDVTKMIKMLVHEPAKFPTKLMTQDVRIDERAELVCISSGDLPITLAWSKNKPITASDKRYLLDFGVDHTNRSYSKLIIAKTERGDSGSYTCNATNKYGSDKTVINLLVQDVPDKPTEVSITNATSTTLSLRWISHFNGNSPISSYLIQYQSDGVEDEELDQDRTLAELSVNQSEPYLVVKDLVPNTVYRVRLAAMNKIGLGDFSDWIRAKTEEAPPAASASRVLVSATGPNSIKVSWIPPERNTWNGQLTGFIIGYRPVDSALEMNKTVDWSATNSADTAGDINSLSVTLPTDTTQSDTTVTANNGKTNNINKTPRELVAHLTNLQRSTTYLAWVIPINSKGAGPRSHSVSVKTLEDVPPSAPLIQVQSTTSDSITFTWSVIASFVSNANQYSLYYRRLLAPLPLSMLPSGSLMNSNGQQPSTSSNSDTRIPMSSSTTVTEGFIERTITNPQLNQFTSSIPGTSSIGILGSSGHTSQANQPDASIINHGAHGLVHYTPGSSSATIGTPSFTTTKAQFIPESLLAQHKTFTYTLDGLECGQVYELYMTTRNSVGKSEPSPTVTTRTDGEAPISPSKYEMLAQVSATEAAINLGTWQSGGCPITHFGIRVKAKHQFNWVNTNIHTGGTPAAISGPSSSSLAPTMAPLTSSLPGQGSNSVGHHQLFTLRNLSPNTAYDLEITAFNSAGSTLAQYDFQTTNSSRRETIFRIGQSNQKTAYSQQSSSNEESTVPSGINRPDGVPGDVAHIVPLILSSALIVLVLFMGVCFVKSNRIWRKGRSSHNDVSASLSEPRSALRSHCDNKLNKKGQCKNSSNEISAKMPFQSVSMKDFNLVSSSSSSGTGASCAVTANGGAVSGDFNEQCNTLPDGAHLDIGYQQAGHHGAHHGNVHVNGSVSLVTNGPSVKTDPNYQNNSANVNAMMIINSQKYATRDIMQQYHQQHSHTLGRQATLSLSHKQGGPRQSCHGGGNMTAVINNNNDGEQHLRLIMSNNHHQPTQLEDNFNYAQANNNKTSQFTTLGHPPRNASTFGHPNFVHENSADTLNRHLLQQQTLYGIQSSDPNNQMTLGMDRSGFGVNDANNYALPTAYDVMPFHTNTMHSRDTHLDAQMMLNLGANENNNNAAASTSGSSSNGAPECGGALSATQTDDSGHDNSINNDGSDQILLPRSMSGKNFGRSESYDNEQIHKAMDYESLLQNGEGY